MDGLEKPWKAKVIQGINDGKDIIQIMDELHMVPYGFCLLNILKEFKSDGFPREDLEKLIEQARPAIGDRRAENFKKEI